MLWHPSCTPHPCREASVYRVKSLSRSDPEWQTLAECRWSPPWQLMDYPIQDVNTLGPVLWCLVPCTNSPPLDRPQMQPAPGHRVPCTEWCPASCVRPKLTLLSQIFNGIAWTLVLIFGRGATVKSCAQMCINSMNSKFCIGVNSDSSKLIIHPRWCNTWITSCAWKLAISGKYARMSQSSS